MTPALTIQNLLTLIALAITVAAGMGRAPLWPAVLILAIVILMLGWPVR